MARKKCEVRGSRLTAFGDLSTDVDTSFDGACQQLLADPAREPVVDLTRVSSLSSTYVGLIAELALSAGKSGRKLKVVAGPRVFSLLRDAGLGSVAALEEAGKKPKIEG